MLRKTVFITLISLCLPAALANTVRIPEDIEAWAKSLKVAAQMALIHGQHEALTECRFAKPLNRVLVCATYLQRDMNAQLLRATIFTEGGIGNHRQHEVVDTTDPVLKDHADVIGGHDIKSSELNAFYQAAREQCQRGHAAACLTPAEQAFYDTIKVQLQKEVLVLIAFSIQSEQASAKALVSHEYLHARYFLDHHYRQQVQDVWQKLPQKTRLAITKNLIALGYNATDDALIQNEFQAYILMSDAESSQLAAWVANLKPKLQASIN